MPNFISRFWGCFLYKVSINENMLAYNKDKEARTYGQHFSSIQAHSGGWRSGENEWPSTLLQMTSLANSY